MKGAFLIHEKLKEEFDKELDFDFVPAQYGPFDKFVFEAAEELEREGLLEIVETGEYEEDIYRLTGEGEQEASRLFQELPEEERQLVEWIKGRHLSKSLAQLLSFVYNRYPKMAENSELT